MVINLEVIKQKIYRLQVQRKTLIKNHEEELARIDTAIVEEDNVLKKITEIMEPHICKCCHGTGKESFVDAAGSRDYRKCEQCFGTGVNTG
jgi:hypothetical protein